MTSPVMIPIAEIFGDFQRSYRYRLWYGGRGAGKSWSIARMLIALTMTRSLRVLCCREYQNSMTESVHKLLSSQIQDLGLSQWFRITEQTIRGYNGSEFLFKGLARNIQSIKSTEGVDIAWVEEAQTLSQESIDLLLPTIRKEGSEIWFTWNPLEEHAPIETLRESLTHAPHALVRRVNWYDNPWFPHTLNEERLRCYHHSPQLYPHIWEGAYDHHGTPFFDVAQVLPEGAPLPFPEHCDGVYAVMDTTLKGGTGRDGTAVVYCALDHYHPTRPLMILDWDIVDIEGGLLEEWIPTVIDTLEQYAQRTRARHGSLGVYVEDRAAGSIIIPQSQRRGWPVHAIEARLTNMGKDQRALLVASPLHQERLALTEHAFNKTSLFRGHSRNHFLTQVFTFRLNDQQAARRDDDLLDCFCYSIIIGLGDEIGL